MTFEVNLQPCVTYALPPSTEHPPELIQRRPRSKKPRTKTSEERENPKTPNADKHVCCDVSFLVDENKRENGPQTSHCVRKWPHTIATRGARFPDSKLK